MFEFLSMMDNYEQRKVDRYKGEGGLIVDTVAVTDSEKPFETGICYPRYNDGKWVIVELYDTKEEAQTGHNKWVGAMTAQELPEKLIDVSTAVIAQLLDALSEDDLRDRAKS